MEEVSDEEESPVKKRRTVVQPPSTSRRTTVTVEEIKDVEMSSGSSAKPSVTASYTLPSEVIEPGDDKSDKKRATSPTSAFPGFPRNGLTQPKSSAPKAPSKLRFSIQPEKEDKEEIAPAPAPARVPTPLVPAPAPKAAVESKPKDARAFVAAMREDELPKYTFALPMSSPGAGPSTLKARQAALAAPVTSLPTFDFSKAPAPTSASKPSAPSGGFDWGAAGLKPPPKPSADQWTCAECTLVSPASADKCVVCDAPRAGAPKAAPVQGFDWAAAGVKPPPQAGGGQWTCSTCMLKNPVDASQCTVCDTPR